MTATHRIIERFNQFNGLQLAALVCGVGILLQWPLLFNPGYFSHDELQWASRADVSNWVELPWFAWTGIDAYQYRPLTFNLWLWFSYCCFERPHLFHAIFVFWGSVNAALLVALARPHMSGVMALAGALIFVLSPYALYVHGWVGTLADLLVMTAMLVMGLICTRTVRIWPQVWAAGLLTALALLSKESALAIPAVMLVLWLMDQYKPVWLRAALCSGLVVSIYLVLRLPVLLQQPEGTHYTVSFLSAPTRWLEYHFYWIMTNLEEPHTTFSRGWRSGQIGAGLLLLVWLIGLWQTSARFACLILLGGLATLAPVLPIAMSSPQYGYLFAAWYAMLMPVVWLKAAKWYRLFLSFLVLLSLIHGIKVMLEIREVGRIQSVFSPALVEVLAVSKSSEPIRLYVSSGADDWIFIRLTHMIHSYQGVRIEDRVQITTDLSTADYLVRNDGAIDSIPQVD